MISVSIVSHMQMSLLAPLLGQLIKIKEISQIIVTINVEESVPENLKKEQKILFLCNAVPKGFGANHNSAFEHCKSPLFCVLNPDVQILNNPFPELIKSLNLMSADMCAPKVINSNGFIEDSARFFPSPLRILKKIITGTHDIYILSLNQVIFYPEWVAGMFMLFDSNAFRKLNGFDERYFLYYEDVDICARIWKSNMRLLVNQQTTVVHNAQRSSHRNLKYLRWHVSSMCRFFIYHLCRLPKPNPQTGKLI